MARRSIVSVIQDFATKKGELLTRILEGDVLDNTKNAIAAFAFKDFDGNAVFPKLNKEGAIIVSRDPGTVERVSGKLLVAGQTQNTRTVLLTIPLDVDPVNDIVYKKPQFECSCYAEVLFEMVLDLDAAETPLGYAVTSDINSDANKGLSEDEFTVPGGTTAANLYLYVTPYEDTNHQDDIFASMSCVKIEN